MLFASSRFAALLMAGSALLCLTASTVRAQQLGFSLINVDPNISVYGFNDALQIYGVDTQGNVVRSGPNGQNFVTLGTLNPIFPMNTPYAINNSGVLTGYGLDPNFDTRAFVSVGNSLTLIPTLGEQADPTNSQGLTYNNNAYAINNRGQIAGTSDTLYDDGTGNFYTTSHAFVYDNGVLTDLGTIPDLNGVANAANTTTAYGINDAGDVVGYGDTQVANLATESLAFLYHNGQFSSLGTLNDTISSYATGINNEGLIIGASTYQPGNFDMHAFVHSGTGLLTPGDDIGTFGGANSYAFYINDMGQVIGAAEDASGASLPFLYQNHTLYNINDLLPASAGLTVSAVFGISSDGRILGYGTNASGQGSYFVLAVPEPGSMAAMGLGCWVLGVGFARRKRRLQR